MTLEDYFFKHDVFKDKDADEIGSSARATNSDSEASDDETPRQAPSSVSDANSPWIEGVMPERIRLATQQRAMNNKQSKNNGPKGVLNDYKKFKRMEALENEKEDIIRQARLLRIAQGYVRPDDASAQAPPSVLTYSVSNKTEDDDDDDDDDPDSAFMQQYRAQRFAQLSVRDTRPTFDQLAYLSPLAYVDEVNTIDTRTRVVVHLFEPFVSNCQLLNQQLETLAGKHVRVRFIAVEASAADDEIDFKKLPVLLIYQQGQMQHSILNVHEALEGQYTYESVEWLLNEHHVLA